MEKRSARKCCGLPRKAIHGSDLHVAQAGGGEPVEKVSYITTIGDQICGVGYYNQ